MASADNPNEIYLVLEKDAPMDKKYIRQFDNMFAGKDIILTIGVLIRNKNPKEEEQAEVESGRRRPKKEEDADEDKPPQDSPFWDVQS